VLLVVAAVLLLPTSGVPVAPSDIPWVIAQVCVAVGYSVLGAVIAWHQPRNRIGWLLVATGLLTATMIFAEEYAIRGLISGRGSLPGALWMAWLDRPVGYLVFPLGLSLLVLIFPTGRPPARAWWIVLGIGLVATLMSVAAVLLDPHNLVGAPRDSVAFHVRNPTGLSGIDGFRDSLFGLGQQALFTAFTASIVSVAHRWRRAKADERHQLKWLLYVVSLLFVGGGLLGLRDSVGIPTALATVGAFVFIGAFALGIPAAVTIAILKYRLYDIDVVISRTLVYGALGAFITLVYIVIVVGIGSLIGSGGRPNIALSIVATAIVAVAFQPVRERLQKVANRLVYGKRATPYEVLSQFSERVAESYAADDVLPRMARVLADGTGAARADVWLRAGDLLRQAASWPTDSAAAEPARVVGDSLPEMLDTDRAVEVRHQGELLGALTVIKRKGESLTPVEEKLLTDLAGQAGLVLKNVGLTAELLARLEDLRASRQRLVAAQDEERRRLERNLHDGAQQNLVALKVKLGLAEMFAEIDPARAKQTLAELKVDTDEALETLRDLARGIYPQLLADRGLVAALESQARKATLPVEVDADGVGRYPQEIEAAVYFCCLEALQNVQKYSAAQNAVVRLDGSESGLTFEVTDDGQGFDGASVKRGAGLTNMTDRIDALGGRLEISSTPGRGTRVRGSLPVLVAVAPA
jgi:signal transduction histidine kinase